MARDFFILLGEKMRSRSLFKAVLVRSSPLLIRLSVPLCPVGWGIKWCEVSMYHYLQSPSGDSVSLPSGLWTVPSLVVLWFLMMLNILLVLGVDLLSKVWQNSLNLVLVVWLRRLWYSAWCERSYLQSLSDFVFLACRSRFLIPALASLTSRVSQGGDRTLLDT